MVHFRLLSSFFVALTMTAGCAVDDDAPLDDDASNAADALDSKADGAGSGCFRAHLNEAIALNKARREVYARMSGGASRTVSDLLILSERATLALAIPFEIAAFPFQRKGIQIMCDEFVSMDLAAPLTGKLPAPPAPPPILNTWSSTSLARSVRSAYAAGGFEAASDRLEAGLAQLAAYPQYMCMTRHVIESALRASNLAPGHIEAARDAGFFFLSPRSLSWRFVAVQLDALLVAKELDQRAAPLQAQGVPIICSDVPPIPPF